MSLAVALLFSFLLALALVAIRLVRNLSSSRHSLPVTAEWIEELSADRYRPMLRLLDPHEIEFLASQPGYTPRLERQLRIQRCRIFRGYLQCLQRDFERVCTALKLVMTQSEFDRQDLAAALLKQQVLFVSCVMAVQFRLVLYRFGICGVDVSALVNTFDAMRLELRQMVPSGMAVCA